MIFYQSILIVSFLTGFCMGVIELSPHVTISSGTLVGEVGNTLYGRQFYKFWCVPYGKAKRFQPSVPEDSWEGVRDCTSCMIRCVQFPMMGAGSAFTPFESQEDCLILNVFAPNIAKSPLEYQIKLFPVMVFIHGGYFMMGSGLDYSGELFLDENIVLVTINYRLGVFGFLTTGDGTIEANLGMKDQVLALKWVKKNIKYFGGDPNRVTIFGESAGAGSVSHHVLSPMSKGLFHQAIAQSGSSLCPWAYQSRPVEIFQQYIKEINCTGNTIQASVDCLKRKKVHEIVKISDETKWFTELKFPLFPAIENVKPKNSEIFLPDHPQRMLQTGNFNFVPFIIGVIEDMVRDADLLNSLNYNWIAKASIALGLDTRNISASNLNKGLRKVRRLYFGDDDIDQKHLYEAINMFSDSWFVNSLVHTIQAHSNHAPVYPYIFTKKGGLRMAELTGLFDRPIASHADDLPYLFYKGSASSDKDVIFSRLWVSFAYTGIPTHTWGKAKTWPHVSRGSKIIKYYQLDDDTALISEPFKERMDLWRDLVKNEWNELVPYEHVERPISQDD